MIRLVVTDLDGTFWRSDFSVPAEHVAAGAALTDRGVELVVATSRRRRVVADHLGVAGMAPSAVLLDGAMGVDLSDGHRFHDAPFGVDAASDVLALFRAANLEPCLYVDEPDFDVVLAARPSTSRAHLEYLRPVARTGDLDVTAAAHRVYGFSVTGRDEAEMRSLATSLTEYGAEFFLIFEAKYGGWSLVVAPPYVTKWNGVLAHCERRGVAIDEVAAVGDGDNDVDMLRQAAVAIAVRGGADAAVGAADHLIDGPDVGGWSAILDLLD